RHDARGERGDHHQREHAETGRGRRLEQQGAVLAAGRAEDEQTAGAQNQQQQQQPASATQALQQAGTTTQDILVGQGAVEIAHHRWLTSAGWGIANSALSWPVSPSSNQASITCLTTGAATPEPDSPFSTITATAICGLLAGAKP